MSKCLLLSWQASNNSIPIRRSSDEEEVILAAAAVVAREKVGGSIESSSKNQVWITHNDDKVQKVASKGMTMGDK